jgi:hypothetical protein
LTQCAGELDAAYTATVAAAMRAVEEILAGENPETKTGDASRLKTALGALDEATKPLAEMLMDRAMEAMLRKRGIIQ